jgi:hypothetical protein
MLVSFLYDDYTQLKRRAVLNHRLAHYNQHKRDGILFIFRYLFSKRWRYEYELDAVCVEIYMNAGANTYLTEQFSEKYTTSLACSRYLTPAIIRADIKAKCRKLAKDDSREYYDLIAL